MERNADCVEVVYDIGKELRGFNTQYCPTSHGEGDPADALLKYINHAKESLMIHASHHKRQGEEAILALVL